MKPIIFFTGGGSGGHVYPNLPIIESLQTDYSIFYIGGKGGIEKDIVADWGIQYREIYAGKLRRYFSFKNLVDIVKIKIGFWQSLYLFLQYRPKLLFSKGGFVSVPVAFAAWILRIPIYIHEADSTPGLANRIVAPLAKKIFLTFDTYKKSDRYMWSGLPLRHEFYIEKTHKSFKDIFGVEKGEKPLLLITGGSLGAERINIFVRKYIESLTENFIVFHITGKGKIDESIVCPGYIQKEFVKEEMCDVLKYTDIAIARAGAGTMFELFTVLVPTLFIPLPLSASRGDQLENVAFFKKYEACEVLYEEDFEESDLDIILYTMFQKQAVYKQNMKSLHIPHATAIIAEEIKKQIEYEV